MPKKPKVFLSYAHKSAEMSDSEAAAWKTTVRALAERLFAADVDVVCDLFAPFGTDWGRYNSRMSECDFVIVLPSLAYMERWDGTNRADEGAGAVREINTIKGLFNSDQKEWRKKIFVVLLPGAAKRDIPLEIITPLDKFSVNPFSEEGLEDLLRRIYDKPKYVLSGNRERPQLGPARAAIGSAPPAGNDAIHHIGNEKQNTVPRIIRLTFVIILLVVATSTSRFWPSDAPLAAVASPAAVGCQSGWVVSDRGQKQFHYNPLHNPSPEAVFTSGSQIRVSIQGLKAMSVFFGPMDVEVISHSAAIPGIYLPLGCQGEVKPRRYSLNLDATTPTIKAEPGTNPIAYYVNSQEIELLLITVTTVQTVEFRFHLHWTSGTTKGELIIPDKSEKPFRITAATSARKFCIDNATTTWKALCEPD